MSTPMTLEEKVWIDAATYEQLLFRWRFGKLGNCIFVGESADYYANRMKELRDQPGGQECHVAASKAIGWKRWKRI